MGVDQRLHFLAQAAEAHGELGSTRYVVRFERNQPQLPVVIERFNSDGVTRIYLPLSVLLNFFQQLPMGLFR